MTNPTPIDFDPLARREADKAIRWYARRSAATASRFNAELNRAIQQIAAAPLQWPPHLHGTRFYRLHHFPYFVVYRDSPARVEIIAVSHTSRRRGYWRRRLP